MKLAREAIGRWTKFTDTERQAMVALVGRLIWKKRIGRDVARWLVAWLQGTSASFGPPPWWGHDTRHDRVLQGSSVTHVVHRKATARGSAAHEHAPSSRRGGASHARSSDLCRWLRWEIKRRWVAFVDSARGDDVSSKIERWKAESEADASNPTWDEIHKMIESLRRSAVARARFASQSLKRQWVEGNGVRVGTSGCAAA